ncbi:DUF6663 family protein [Halorubrum amylolyticum]|uniref:DUF6663 family protein n=1 Tax=Halorubrum amylolyticum TaxID=2508724 RepID=UPI001008C5CB|nr:DUF6663 family protein [Halorubrum amylolyticum]
MEPTTSGRFRVHDRRPRPDIDGTGPSDPPEEFVLVEHPEGPIDPTDPDAEDRFDPLYAAAEGYEGELADRVASLEPGFVADATLAWTDGSARFADVAVVRESRFRFADDVEGMFEAAVDAWDQIRSAGEAVGSVTTRSNDGEPNGALYLFADAPGSDAFADLRAGRLPIEPLVARVNESREDDDPREDDESREDADPREVFVLRPAAHDFVAVYVVFDREGVLAQTVRDTYDLGPGLAAGLDDGALDAAKAGSESGDDGADSADGDGGDEDGFDALDRL